MKEDARKLLKKGKRSAHAAETLLREGDYEFAAGRAYYVMLHAAQALLREQDLRYRKHASVHASLRRALCQTRPVRSQISPLVARCF